MRTLLPLLALAFVAAGCSGGTESGDVETAKKAAAAMPTSVEQLPANMPPEARRQAEGAMAQSAAMSAQMNKQAEAMRAARSGGN